MKGDASKRKAPRRLTSMRLDEELRDAVDAAAAKVGLDRTAFYERGARMLLAEVSDPPTAPDEDAELRRLRGQGLSSTAARAQLARARARARRA